MPVTPTSPAAKMAHEVRNLIASSATFITAVAAVDYIAAKNNVFILEALPEMISGKLTYKRPNGIVLLPVTDYRTVRCGIPSGEISFYLEINSPVLTAVDELTTVANFFDGVLLDISKLGNPHTGVVNDAALRFARVSQKAPYQRTRITDGEHSFWRAAFSISLDAA